MRRVGNTIIKSKRNPPSSSKKKATSLTLSKSGERLGAAGAHKGHSIVLPAFRGNNALKPLLIAGTGLSPVSVRKTKADTTYTDGTNST